MRTKTTAPPLALAALLGCLALPAQAQPAGGPPKGGPATAPKAGQTHAHPRPIDLPNLTPSQQQQIQELSVKTYDKLSPLRRQLLVKRGELQQLWSVDAPNRDAILKKLAEMDAVRQKVQQARVDQRLALLALLTPEQRAAFRSQGPGAMGHGRGMGRMGMGASGDCMGMMSPESCMDMDMDMDDCMDSTGLAEGKGHMGAEGKGATDSRPR